MESLQPEIISEISEYLDSEEVIWFSLSSKGIYQALKNSGSIKRARYRMFTPIELCKRGSLNGLRYLIEYRRQKIKLEDEKATMELVFQNKDPDFVRYLTLKIQDKQWCLLFAVSYGKIQLVKFALAQGAELKENNLLLYNAAEEGQLETMKFLVSLGIDPRCNMSLCSAAKNGHLNVVEYLVEQGSDLRNSLETACLNGRLEIVRYLVSKGTHITEECLSNACFTGSLELVKYLDSMIQITDYSDMVKEACIRGRTEILKFFGSKGANLTQGTDLMTACSYNHGDTVRYLIEKGSDPTYNNNASMSYACYRGNIEMMKFLIEKIGYVDRMALTCAVKTSQLDAVKYLVEKQGVDVASDDSAIKEAVRQGNKNMIVYLTSKGAIFQI